MGADTKIRTTLVEAGDSGRAPGLDAAHSSSTALEPQQGTSRPSSGRNRLAGPELEASHQRLLVDLRALLGSVDETVSALQGDELGKGRAELGRLSAHARHMKTLVGAQDLLRSGEGEAVPLGAGVAASKGRLMASDDSTHCGLILALTDDDTEAFAGVSSELVEAGHRVVLAESLEAIDPVDSAAELPALILLDARRSLVEAGRTCLGLRRRFERACVPVLLLTSAEGAHSLADIHRVGASDYVTWPARRGELRARVQTQLAMGAISRAYGRFVPKEFLRFLKRESIVDVHLGDYVQREMTVMFMDIRSFTSLSESMSPEQNFNFLNSYLQRVGPVIHAHGGFIDKYVGDGIMALFPDSPGEAVSAAIDIRSTLNLYNEHRANCNYRPIEVGIGIHTGTLILGTIGYADRMETTVISDSVNLASRLESLNKEFGSTTIISESTLAAVQERFDGVRYLGQVRVAGRAAAVPVFELFEGEVEQTLQAKRATLELFEQGVRLYEQGELAEACVLFEAGWREHPSDDVCRRFWERCVELRMAFGPRLARSAGGAAGEAWSQRRRAATR